MPTITISDQLYAEQYSIKSAIYKEMGTNLKWETIQEIFTMTYMHQFGIEDPKWLSDKHPNLLTNSAKI